jgi:hypothetical protein
MEFLSVREVADEQPKSNVAIEKELLEKHVEETKQAEPPATDTPAEAEPPTLDETAVLSHINKKYQKGYTSFDELLTPQTVEKEVELPEDVSAFYKFKQETGRGLSDYMKIQRDFAKENPDTLLAEYMASQNSEFDADEIADVLKERFGYDETLDDEETVKRQTRAKKKELSKAIAHFENLKEQYKAPLESSSVKVPDEEKEAYEAYKKEVSSRQTEVEKGKVLSNYFVQKTNELFSNNFKGFEFKVGDKAIVYTPGDVEKVKQSQINVNNFIGSHLNEEGYLKDAGAYHKSLAVAMNPDLFANHFYEQGKADAIAAQSISDKNIHMGSIRNAPEVVKSGEGIKMRALDESNGSSLKILSQRK